MGCTFIFVDPHKNRAVEKNGIFTCETVNKLPSTDNLMYRNLYFFLDSQCFPRLSFHLAVGMMV